MSPQSKQCLKEQKLEESGIPGEHGGKSQSRTLAVLAYLELTLDPRVNRV